MPIIITQSNKQKASRDFQKAFSQAITWLGDFLSRLSQECGIEREYAATFVKVADMADVPSQQYLLKTEKHHRAQDQTIWYLYHGHRCYIFFVYDMSYTLSQKVAIQTNLYFLTEKDSAYTELYTSVCDHGLQADVSSEIEEIHRSIVTAQLRLKQLAETQSRFICQQEGIAQATNAMQFPPQPILK